MLRKPPPAVLWCAPALFLLAVALGVAIVLRRPLSLFAGVLAALAAVPVGWVIVSALWPARAERRCPACGKDALQRLDERATHGLVCRACGHRDESASAWLLAEEEGPLEEIVLAERGRKRPAAPVDSPRRTG
jgi:DNA-directed RNA polymerase subunit RPC12/RpoP